MPTEARQNFTIEILHCDGGLHLLPSPPRIPKEHRFQGGLTYSSMLEIEGRVLAPQSLAGARMRIWLSQIKRWHFSPNERAYIGSISDRSEGLTGGCLEASLYIPEDAWLTSVGCLSTTWRSLNLNAVEHEDGDIRVVEFSFHGG